MKDKAQPHPMSERYYFGALLTVVGGFLDAYTYLTRGRVFATAQTGNIVLLGLRLADGAWSAALAAFIPVLAYALGVIAAELLRRRIQSRPHLHWRQVVLAVEALLLLAVAFVPSGRCDPAVNTAVAFLAALQMQSFRRMHGNAFATTMCTGNLRSGSEEFYAYLRGRDRGCLLRAAQYYSIILFFVLGAGLSAWLTHLLGERSILLCCVLLLASLGLLALHREPDGGA